MAFRGKCPSCWSLPITIARRHADHVGGHLGVAARGRLHLEQPLAIATGDLPIGGT